MMTEKQKMYVEKYHDYVVRLITSFNVDEAEFYDELCITLCEAAIGKIGKNVDQYFTRILAQKFVTMLERKLKEYDMLVPLEDADNISKYIDTERIHTKLAVDNAKASLSTELQKCVDMYFFEGYTLNEISEELGISRSTVYQRLREANGALRKSQVSLKDC